MTELRDHRTGQLCWRERPACGEVPAAATVVCLHGIGSDARSFDGLAAALPGTVRVIAWAAPGYGGSDPLPQPWPIATDYGAALGGLTEALGLSRYVLLGHSLGTLVGAAHALASPERVAALVLVSCAQGMGIAPGAELPASAANRLRDLDTQGAAAFARARAPRLIHDPDRHPELVGVIEAAMARVAMPGYGQAVRMLAAGDLSDMARRLAVPTTVVVGDKDAVTPLPQSRAVWEALSPPARKEIAILPGVGHALPQQAPAALARIVERTLSGAAFQARAE